MLSWSPSKYYLSRALGRYRPRMLEDVAVKTVEVAPSIRRRNRPSIMLPGSLERVTGYGLGTDRAFESRRLSDDVVVHGATHAYKLRNAVLLDGNLFCEGEAFPFLERRQRRLFGQVIHESRESALTGSIYGSMFFAHWLLDDCVRYLIAGKYGHVVAPVIRPHSHQPGYERLAGMQVDYCNAVVFDTLWVFDDRGQNNFKRQRYHTLREILLRALGAEGAADHPGVYITRGLTGKRRLLVNEAEVAERFRQRGFRVLEPAQLSTEEILRASVGAKVVAGVEGSALAHALSVMAPESTLLAINPPSRFNSFYKDIVDCIEMNHAVMVGHASGQDFALDVDEIDRMLELLDKPQAARNVNLPAAALANELRV